MENRFNLNCIIECVRCVEHNLPIVGSLILLDFVILILVRLVPPSASPTISVSMIDAVGETLIPPPGKNFVRVTFLVLVI